MVSELTLTRQKCKDCGEKKLLKDFRPSDHTRCCVCWSTKYQEKKLTKEARDRQKDDEIATLRRDNTILIELTAKLVKHNHKLVTKLVNHELEERLALEKQMRKVLRKSGDLPQL